MSGKHAYLPLLALFRKRGINPTQPLHVARVHAHANPHAGFADPDVIVTLATVAGKEEKFTVSELLPGVFTPAHMANVS